jgi:penicillin-binding protein 1B
MGDPLARFARNGDFMATSRAQKPGSAKAVTRQPRRRCFAVLGSAIVVLVVAGAVLFTAVDRTTHARFESQRWELPAHVYARPLELYAGAHLTLADVEGELQGLGYRSLDTPDGPGSYRRGDDRLAVVSRPFVFWDGAQPSAAFTVRFVDDEVRDLRSATTGEVLDLVRLEPLLIDSIYPARHEDRLLVQLSEVPRELIAALLVIEDRGFYQHHGFDLRAVARALVANLRAGRVVQGGSTLTQQLVKNFYLSSERTVWRKLVELPMAVSLELHYSKEAILEAYINEIYLGQQGNRAIHGFGLASQYYFQRPLSELGLAEVALLVGMVRAPSYYSPVQHPHRAMERRNFVLSAMASQGQISDAAAAAARAAPLGVQERPRADRTAGAAFVDLVREQLRRDYRDEDLRTAGLRIFTTLDPRVQRAAVAAVDGRLRALEESRPAVPHDLQGALVVATVDQGEVVALVGGRDAITGGFNRALQAARPLGSLIKPAIYLTALERPDAFTLATLVDDGPLVWEERGAPPWEPQNLDGQFHGPVPLRTALSRSYNVATARLGLQLGLEPVIATLRRLGIERPIQPYPSLLLGAIEASPLEVAQMYQTIASGGFRVPLRAIREVLTADGVPLRRYPLSIEPAVEPAPIYLLTTVLQEVTRTGTARGLVGRLPRGLAVAGKTGTSDDYRDSWFAGFTGDLVAVVWIGRDDDRPVGLTGASGAMLVWSDLMSRLRPAPLALVAPDGIEETWVDEATGLLAGAYCPGAVRLPFIAGSAPTQVSACAPASAPQGFRRWLRRWFR